MTKDPARPAEHTLMVLCLSFLNIASHDIYPIFHVKCNSFTFFQIWMLLIIYKYILKSLKNTLTNPRIFIIHFFFDKLTKRQEFEHEGQ